jgi:CheY-like chemotaxis protein
MTEPTILIIEDNEGHFRIMEKSFERFGVTNPITHLADGEAALDYLLRRGGHAETPLPALLLLIIDLNLPRLNGIDILRELVKQPHLNSIPRIILSTSDEPEDVAACKEYGYAAYYVKPADYLKLSSFIKDLNSAKGGATPPKPPGTGSLAPPVTPSEGGTKPLRPTSP